MKYFLQIQASLDKHLFWGISYDAWFTGLTPILIFILGYIVNEIVKKFNEQKRLKELEEYFRKLIELLNKPLNKQTKEFLKFSHSLKEKKEQILILNDVTNFHVEQIKDVNNKYQQDYKNIIDRSDYLFREMISQSQSTPLQQDVFLFTIDKIRLAWFELENKGINYKDMYVVKEMYLEPMRNLCNQNIRDSRSAIMLKEIMPCIYLFNNIESTKKVFRRHYLLLAKKLQNSWFEINVTLKKFDSLKKSS